MKTTLSLFATCALACHLQAQVSFAPATNYPVGGISTAVVTADMNGDGKLDLICNTPNQTVAVLTNDGSGGFAVAGTYTQPPTRSIATADINGDGKPDLICANFYSGSLMVLTNDRTGGLVVAGNYAVGNTPFSVAAADVNGDGLVDLVSANYNDNTLSVLTNTGTGNFVTAGTYVVGGGPAMVTTADVNGDGNADLINANESSGTLSVLTNNGSGGFVTAGTYAVDAGPIWVTTADVNGDGKVDLISANYYSNTLTVLTNDGSGHFAASGTYTTGGYPQSVAAADVNGDGKVDLICANSGESTLSVLTNDGSGGFAAAGTLAVGSGPEWVTAADLNGDGKVDLVSANINGPAISVLLNTTGLPILPVITVQPQSQTNIVGGTVGFNVTASGTAPLSYQWNFNGTNIVGATNATLTLTNLLLTQAGNYSVLVSNSAGSVTSSPPALLTVTPATVTQDNAVVVWGNNSFGQNSVPSGLTNVAAVAAGYDYAVALKMDGTVLAWGESYAGATNIPTGLTNVVAIASGEGHIVALKSDGTVVVWGDNNYGEANVPAGLTNVVAIAAGAYHTVALKSDGTVVAWGYNYAGTINVPTGLTNVTAIAAGYHHTVALKSDGTVIVWGESDNGEANIPAGLSNVTEIAASQHHTVALKSDGTVVAWGDNADGSATVPAGLSGATAVAAGGENSVALKSDGTVVVWGDNTYSQTNVPSVVANAVAIAAGEQNIVALLLNTPPIITAQPQSQTNIVGGTVGFNVMASGTAPLSYQWNCNGTNIVGATNATLTLSNVQLTQAGNYSVLVSNLAGSTNSAAAILAITLPGCTPPPAGIVAWWPAEGNANDIIGSNNGNPSNGVAFVAGVVGQAFSFNGSNSFVEVPDSVSLELTNTLTIEFWVKRQQIAGRPYGDIIVEKGGDWTGGVENYGVGFGSAGYGNLFQFFFAGGNRGSVSVNDLNWHHCAVVAHNGDVDPTFYLDGVLQPVSSRQGASTINLYPSTRPLHIGAQIDPNWVYYSDTLVDEVSIYNRALSQAEIQAIYLAGSAGKCYMPVAPAIINQPLSQTNIVGGSASFNVTASGTAPLSYQWNLNGTNIVGATNTTLTLMNVQLTQSGNYSVLVSNSAGSVTSSPPAVLTVTPATITQGNAVVVVWGNNSFGQNTVPAGLTNVSAVAAGYDYAVALKMDGTVLAWGESYAGATNIPAGLTNVVAIASGEGHIVALKNNGTVTVLGDNNYGEANVPASLTNVVAIAAGAYHTVALKSNGTVVAWGDNYDGAINVPAGLTNVTAIAAGYHHTVALKNDGSVIVWGESDNGEANIPAGLSNVTEIAASQHHTVALKSDGTVVAWGDNAAGSTTVPAGLSGVTAVAAGGENSVALKSDGTVVVWGDSTYGQTNIPSGLTNVVAIAAGEQNIVALLLNTSPIITAQPQNATVAAGATASLSVTATGVALSYQWQAGPVGGPYTNLLNGGQLSGATSNILTIANATTNWTLAYQVIVTDSAGSVTSSPPALLTVTPNTVTQGNAVVVVWGDNSFGQNNVPAGLTNVVAVAAGYDYAVALKMDGTVLAWGESYAGATNIPAGLTNVVAIASGEGHIVALKSDGTVTVWGDNNYGEANVPASLTNVVAIAAGAYHTVALRSDGTVVAWGDNYDGAINVPAGLTNVTAIAAGYHHTVALKNDGSVVVWGESDNGEANIPAGLTNVTAIAASQHHTVALKSDGTVVAWGDNADGSTTVPAGLSSVTAVAAGGENSVALKSDGTVVVWGDSTYGQTNVPSGLTNVVAIAAGEQNIVALLLNTPPIITTQPQSAAVAAGTTVSLSVTATGAALSYQWQAGPVGGPYTNLVNGGQLSGVTGNVLTIANATTNWSLAYQVIVTDSYGSVTSSPAILDVRFIFVSVNGQLAAPTVSVFISGSVTLSGGFPGGFLFYTLDGSLPTTSSALYTGPITLTNSAVIQALGLSADFSLTGYSAPVTLTVIPGYTLQTSVLGSGTVSVNPTNGPYFSNSVVTLTATASAYWAFNHWAGDASGSQNPLSLAADGPLNIQAVFTQAEFPLTVGTLGGGTVAVNGQAIAPATYYPNGSVVTLSATANNGWSFLGWQGSTNSTANPLSLTINQTNNLQAVFGTVVATNAVGGGSIVLSQTNPVPYGTLLTASAVPAAGHAFVVWSGAASGTNAPVVISVTNGSPALNALFALLPNGKYSLSVVVAGNGSVVISPQQNSYNPGDTVTLSALTTNAGSHFFGWTGSASSPSNTIVVVMSTNQIVQANFIDFIPPALTISSPTPGQSWSNQLFTISGTATDNVAVAGVFYQFNSNGWYQPATVNNWTNWQATVSVLPGTNTLQAYAVDTTGNLSPTSSVSFVCILSDVLQVQTSGRGTISPNYSNAVLQVGKNYTVTATPVAGSGFAFTNWTGGTSLPLAILTNGPVLQFQMASNLMLQANFVDTNWPVINITNVTAGLQVSNASLLVKGTATDNVAVAGVFYNLNAAGWSNATSLIGSNWTAAVTLSPGTNTFAVYAVDPSGNHSFTNQVAIDYVVNAPLTLLLTGRGTISPNYSNAVLQVGKNYTVTAAVVAGSGFAFANWTGGTSLPLTLLTNGPVLQFQMASNLVLSANFADTNPPTLTITYPTQLQHLTNALATVTGTAGDNWQVGSVWYQSNGGIWSQPSTTNHWTNWNTTVELQKGTNLFRAYAVDTSGNFSLTNSVSIVSSNSFALSLAFTTVRPLATNGLNFALQVSPGLNGHIQVSTNLINWVILTNFIGTNSTIYFRDPAATNFNDRYYRAVVP